ncbi:hypothetical protein C8F04DRAFT_1271454 [Mycena alexandri]|uniref:DUF5648 domain-containing protein n=1 Tax=Mycena alexandri TaxID=1745969 RepID=A0AAD6SBT1_9AGAR|nr:hypothetical protein C8F04DRAFT_1271454 [Mycena alexandri]
MKTPTTTATTVFTAALATLLTARPIRAAFVDPQAQAVFHVRDSLRCPQSPSTALYPDTAQHAYQLHLAAPPRPRGPAIGGHRGYFEFDGPVARVFEKRQRATVPLVHLFNPNTYDSVFTRDPPARHGENEPELRVENTGALKLKQKHPRDSEEVNWSARGYTALGIAAYIFPRRVCGGVPFFALERDGAHFHTADQEERDDAIVNEGYTARGVVGSSTKCRPDSCLAEVAIATIDILAIEVAVPTITTIAVAPSTVATIAIAIGPAAPVTAPTTTRIAARGWIPAASGGSRHYFQSPTSTTTTNRRWRWSFELLGRWTRILIRSSASDGNDHERASEVEGDERREAEKGSRSCLPREAVGP